MKIIKDGISEVYDFTCEEVIEGICPVCKAMFEYTQNDCETEIVENPFYAQEMLAYNSSFYNPYRGNLRFSPPLPMRSHIITCLVCPCCSNKMIYYNGALL